MSNTPLVSVVITTYGRPLHLKRAIECVFAQTYTNYELFIVDDNELGSEFSTLTQKVIHEITSDKYFHYIQHKHNRGGSAARNTGAKNAKGSYVAFCDDDDEWFPQKLEKQIEYFESLHDNIGVIYCSYILVEYNGEKVYKRDEKGDLTKELLLLQFDPGASSTLVFRKDVLKKIGYFDENFARHQDLEVLIRLCRNYRIDVCPDVLLKINGHNFPSAAKSEKVRNVFFQAFNNDINKLSFSERRKVYAKHYMQLSSLFLSEKKLGQMGKYYIKAIGQYPSILFGNIVNRRLWLFLTKRIYRLAPRITQKG